MRDGFKQKALERSRRAWSHFRRLLSTMRSSSATHPAQACPVQSPFSCRHCVCGMTRVCVVSGWPLVFLVDMRCTVQGGLHSSCGARQLCGVWHIHHIPQPPHKPGSATSCSGSRRHGLIGLPSPPCPCTRPRNPFRSYQCLPSTKAWPSCTLPC